MYNNYNIIVHLLFPHRYILVTPDRTFQYLLLSMSFATLLSFALRFAYPALNSSCLAPTLMLNVCLVSRVSCLVCCKISGKPIHVAISFHLALDIVVKVNALTNPAPTSCMCTWPKNTSRCSSNEYCWDIPVASRNACCTAVDNCTLNWFGSILIIKVSNIWLLQ